LTGLYDRIQLNYSNNIILKLEYINLTFKYAILPLYHVFTTHTEIQNIVYGD